MTAWLRLTLLGTGAMNSPRYPPAGLLVCYRRRRVMIDGGPGAEPARWQPGWSATNAASCALLAALHGVRPAAAAAAIAGLVIEPHPVVHTSQPTWGYLLRLPAASAVWAPEFWQFPAWAAGADLMFADAAGWNRPIPFARGAGGHMAALDVAGQARQHQVKRLVFAHIGRPSLRAIDAGYHLPFGEWGQLGRTYRIPASGSRGRTAR